MPNAQTPQETIVLLRKTLEMAYAELVTLHPYLSGRFQSSVGAAKDQIKEVLKQTEQRDA